MKTARAYLLSAFWFVTYCAAAYYGWGQDVAGVRNLIYVSLALGVGFNVFFVLIGFAAIHAENVGKEFARPKPIKLYTSAPWVIWRMLILSFVFAWFGALFVAIAMPMLTVMTQLARIFFNTAVAKSNE